MVVDQKLKAQHPSSPWLWNRGWVEKRIQHSHARDGMALLGFAVVWNAFVWSCALFVLKGDEPAPVRWVIWTFAALGVLLLWGGLRGSFIGMRFGTTTLHVSDVPQRLGRRFRAELRARRIPDGTIWTSVACVLRRTRRPHFDTVWTEEREVPRASVQELPDGWRIPIEFDLPATADESRNLGELDEVSWKVTVSIGADKGTPTIRGEYPIPVFGGAAKEVSEFDVLLAELPDELREKIEKDLASPPSRPVI